MQSNKQDKCSEMCSLYHNIVLQRNYLMQYGPENADKWDYWLCHSDWAWLRDHPKLFQAKLIKYYMKLSTAEPTEKIKEYYDKLMDDINELVGHLNDWEPLYK